MRMERECVECNTKMIFTKKDIRKVTKKEMIEFNKKVKPWKDMLDETEEIGWFKKKKRYKYVWGRPNIKEIVKEPKAVIVCPCCKTEQFIR